MTSKREWKAPELFEQCLKIFLYRVVESVIMFFFIYLTCVYSMYLFYFFFSF